jgi:hypothetical protein
MNDQRKTFLSTKLHGVISQMPTGDETWVYGYNIETKGAIVAVGGKIVAATKKSTSESIKCEGVDLFFLLEGGRSS